MGFIIPINLINKWHLFQTGDNNLYQLFNLWLTIMLVTAFICFVVSELSHNYSQVDKVWSIMPVVYSWVTLSFYPSSPRIWIMTLLVTIWGIRLSYNFYRKGGYSLLPWKGQQDYRWGILRQHPVLNKGFRFTLFNMFFISLYQNVIILLISTPLLLASENYKKNLTLLDFLTILFMLLFILIETKADNQLHIFQTHKRNKIIPQGKFNSSLKNGFLSVGLWHYVRHPNFTAEQAIWIGFYSFGVAASGQLINWTLAGPVLLILLFAGSSEFTERISKEKYPGYVNYQQEVPKFIPLIFRSKKRKNKLSEI